MSGSTAYGLNYTVMKVSALSSARTADDIGIALDGSTPFSVDAWVRFNGLCSSASILSKEGVFDFGIAGNTVLLQITGSQPVQSDPTRQALDDGSWHYLCATFDGGSVRLYIDGRFNYMQGISGTGAANDNPFLIGSGLQALIKAVRVYNTSLDADTVMLNMFGEPSPSSIVAYFDFASVPPVDRGGGRLPIQLQNGAAMVTNTPAMALSGTAYAQPLLEWRVNPGGHQVDPYTVQSWVYVESPDHPRQAIFVNSDLESDTGMALYLQYDDGAEGFRVVSTRGANVTANALSSNSVVPPDTWVNVATTFDGTTLTIYIQGDPDASGAFGPIPLIRETSNLLIGAASSQGQPAGATALQGYIAQVAVWERALGAAEIARYLSSPPDAAADGLTAVYDFTSLPARNLLNGHPIGLADGAKISGQVSSAVPGVPTLDEAALQHIHHSLDFTDFLSGHGHLLEEAMEEDVRAFAGDPAGQQLIRDAWRDAIDRLRSDPPSPSFMVTSHLIGDDHVLLCHTRRGTHVAFQAKAASVDECAMWKVRLVFIVVAGVLDAFFGLRAVINRRAQNYIARILTNSRISTLMANGRKMTAGLIFALASTMWSLGFFRELLYLIVDLGFWALVRVFARLVLKLVGVGAVDVVASLAATAATFIYAYTYERPSSCDPLPNVDLAAIKFNHDPTALAVDALSLRKNYRNSLTGPEWVKGRVRPEESPAAYSIAAVRENVISIQARFTISTNTATEVQIKAEGGGILGPIGPVTVNFSNGVSTPEFVTLSLANHTIGRGSTAGILKRDIQWTWYYKVGSSDWVRINTTKHRIYTVLDTPTAPWRQSARLVAETQLPWVDALEYACAWAEGKTTPRAAAEAITQKVNGGINLTYEMTQGGTAYTQMLTQTESVFLCTEFLKFLGDGSGKGTFVNCTDCACIVSTFANLVGCNLTQSIMYSGEPFNCNKVIVIGKQHWAYPSPYPPHEQFMFHEVAWEGALGYTDHIFDACLKLDSSDDPWAKPDAGRRPVLPVRMVFTTQGVSPELPIKTPFTDQCYRERLTQNNADGIGRCKPRGAFDGTAGGRRRLI